MSIPTTLEDLAALLAKRDNISIEEARDHVNSTHKEIQSLFNDDLFLPTSDLYEEVINTIQNNLGLEPDYLDLFF